jgi:hypothetical protein
LNRIARDRHPRLEQLTLIRLILHRDPYRDGLEALKSRGRLEVRALLAAVERSPAFGTRAPKIDVSRQSRGAIKATGRGHRLHEAREPRTGNV